MKILNLVIVFVIYLNVLDAYLHVTANNSVLNTTQIPIVVAGIIQCQIHSI